MPIAGRKYSDPLIYIKSGVRGWPGPEKAMREKD